MYDGITGRSPIATDDLGYIGTGQKASQIMSGGTTDYDALTNKPTINNVELKGNKTSSDLGLQSSLTETQTNAVNSGITAVLTEQITTNQTNISLIKHAVNTSIYIQETEPTNPNNGDYWISTTATKIYSCADVPFSDSDIKSAYIGQSDGIYHSSQSSSRSLVIPCISNTTYQINYTSKTMRIAFYSSSPVDDDVPVQFYNETQAEYGSHTSNIISPATAAYICINCYLSTVEAAEGKTIDEIFDALTIKSIGGWS